MKRRFKGIPPFMEENLYGGVGMDDHIGFRIIEQKKGDYYLSSGNAYHHLVFVLEGFGKVACDEYLGKDFNPGDLFFVSASTEVCDISMTDTRALVITFSNKFEPILENYLLGDRVENMDENLFYNFSSLKIKPQITRFLETIEYYLSVGILCPFLNELKLKELLVILRYNYSQQELRKFFHPILVGEVDFKVCVLNVMSEHWGISEMASDLGMSPRTFSRKFKAEFGEPARYWLLKQKAKYIKLRLLIPGVTLNSIIDEFHFTDMSHFAKFCKEHYQCTPAELVKQLREGKKVFDPKN